MSGFLLPQIHTSPPVFIVFPTLKFRRKSVCIHTELIQSSPASAQNYVFSCLVQSRVQVSSHTNRGRSEESSSGADQPIQRLSEEFQVIWPKLNLFFFVLQPLDYESKKAYTFKVEASNAHMDPRFQSFGAFKDTATVKINVLDVDEPPVFNKPSYVMDVYEDTPAGTIIGAVTAQDLDASSSPVR